MKICMPAGSVAGIDHPTAGRIHARKGVVDVPDHIARDLIKYDECFPAANKARAVDGFVCESCGFNGYFRKCGRCGGTCHRPNHHQEEVPDGTTPQAV